jgi:phosphomevalonate kinase
MDPIEVSAPGKLVLFGEYAVLFGAPAAVAAVDRRAVVTLHPFAGDGWEIAAPGLVSQPARLAVEPGNSVRWDDEKLARGALGLVDKLLQNIGESGSIDLVTLPPLAATLDTRAFFESAGSGECKLGLGSSAALTVAFASALEVWSGGGPTAEVEGRLQGLVDLHRGVQGGAGSGIDVAASLLGGVIRYQLAGDGSVAQAAPLVLPESLRMVFVWTGRAASTGDFLGRLRDRREEVPREVNSVLDELGAVSSIGVSALADGDAEGFLEAVDAFWQALDQLGIVIGMPILSDEHHALRRIAADCGVRYKPSGAGGGDFGIGFATDEDAAAALRSGAGASGFHVLELGLDHSGVLGSSV